MAARIQSLRNGIDPVDEASRNDLVPGDVIVLSSLDGCTTYSWTIVFAPKTSAATFSGSSTGVSPGSFTVDKEGPYLIRLITDAGLVTEDVQYVRLRALTSFGGLRLVAAGERRDGTGIIPVDVDTEGWANDQNENLTAILGFLRPLVESGRVYTVDARAGGVNSGNYVTVQAAISAAVTAGASQATPWLVRVHPGTYVENVTFSPWVRVLGDGPGTVLQGNHTIATGGAALDEIRIQSLELQTSASTTVPVVSVTGVGVAYIEDSFLYALGNNAAQGSALLLSGGGRTVVARCTVEQLSTNGAGCWAVVQTGSGSRLEIESSRISGPSGVSSNSSQNAGVTTLLSHCEIRSYHASGRGIYTLAELVDIRYCNIFSVGADTLGGNTPPVAYAGDVEISVQNSEIENNLKFDTTTLSGSTSLLIGGLKCGALVFPAGPPGTLVATTRAESLAYNPANLVDWGGAAPTSIAEALDRIAAVLTPVP